MRWSKRRKQFRSLLAGDRCVHPTSVFDPISARIADDLGFEAGMLAGSVASMTVLGAPDLILLTLSELAGQAYRIGRASELPLLVDADHGFGNALNVKRTVEEKEAAVQVVYLSLKALREGAAPNDLEYTAPPELMKQVTRSDDYRRWSSEFLGGISD